jgi:very-short-patch-repair endonuclease
MKQTARELRRSQIEAERVFWNHVRGRRLSGLSFAGSTALDRLS